MTLEEFKRMAAVARWTLVPIAGCLFACRVPPRARAQGWRVCDCHVGTYSEIFKSFCTNLKPKTPDDPRLWNL
jgi:hypothetical protein